MAATEQLIDTLTANLQPVKPLRKPWLRAILWCDFATLIIAVIAAVGGSGEALAHAVTEAGFLIPLVGSWLTGVTAAFAAFHVSLPDRSRRWVWLPVLPILLWGTGFAVSCLTNWNDVLASLALLPESACLLTIVLTSAAGFALASRGTLDYLALFRSLLGIALLSSGIATLNQYAERDLDGLMRRTANRPLPSGKLAPWEALAFGAGITILAELYLLILVNPLTALLGLTVIAGYVFAYTPLKTRTSLSTLKAWRLCCG